MAQWCSSKSLPRVLLCPLHSHLDSLCEQQQREWFVTVLWEAVTSCGIVCTMNMEWSMLSLVYMRISCECT